MELPDSEAPLSTCLPALFLIGTLGKDNGYLWFMQDKNQKYSIF